MTTVDPRKTVIPTILSPLFKKKPEGFRHLWLGDTGMGKTYANNILINDNIIKKRLIDIVLTVDDKDPEKSQYGGYQVINPNHLKYRFPSKEESRHINFRGVAYRRDLRDTVSPDDVAQMGWDLIRESPVSVLINVDELADATNGHQGWLGDVTAQIYRKGRAVRLSVVATTQLPQLLPREAFALSETIGIFRMDAREASYLVKYRVLTPEMETQITKLTVGEFMLYRKGGGGWDGKIYKF
jgi:hypothetical protein